jgi:GTP-binding protein
VLPADGTDPVENALAITRELERFSPSLAARERWLVLNKTDLVDAGQLQAIRERLLDSLAWEGPIYEIAAISGVGTEQLCNAIMERLETLRELEDKDPEIAAAEQAFQQQLQAESRERIAALRERRKSARAEASDELDDDDDYDVDVEYAP